MHIIYDLSRFTTLLRIFHYRRWEGVDLYLSAVKDSMHQTQHINLSLTRNNSLDVNDLKTTGPDRTTSRQVRSDR